MTLISSLFMLENLPLFIFSLGFSFSIFLYARDKIVSKINFEWVTYPSWVKLWVTCSVWVVITGFVLMLPFFLAAGRGNLSPSQVTGYTIVSVGVMFGIGALISFFIKDKILLELSEFKIVLFGLMFSYICYLLFGVNQILFVSFLPFFITLFLCLSEFTPGFKTKLLLYVWFLFCWLFFSATIFFNGAFFSPTEIIGFPVVGYFFFGMSSFILVSFSCYLYFLLPITRKYESFSDAIKRSKEMAHSMVAKFDDVNTGRMAVLFALVLFAVVLAANTILKLVEPTALVAFFLSASGIVDLTFPKQKK